MTNHQTSDATDQALPDLTSRIEKLKTRSGDDMTEDEKKLLGDSLTREAGFPPRALSAARRALVEDSRSLWAERLKMITGTIGTKKGTTVAIYGEQGKGKTVMGVAIGLVDISARRRRVHYCKVFSFLLKCEAAMKPDARDSRESVVARFADYGLLILDECGKAFNSDAEKRLVFELIDERYSRFKDTLLISNHSKPEFELWLGTSLVARINEAGGFLNADWEAKRA